MRQKIKSRKKRRKTRIRENATNTTIATKRAGTGAEAVSCGWSAAPQQPQTHLQRPSQYLHYYYYQQQLRHNVFTGVQSFTTRYHHYLHLLRRRHHPFYFFSFSRLFPLSVIIRRVMFAQIIYSLPVVVLGLLAISLRLNNGVVGSGGGGDSGRLSSINANNGNSSSIVSANGTGSGSGSGEKISKFNTVLSTTTANINTTPQTKTDAAMTTTNLKVATATTVISKTTPATTTTAKATAQVTNQAQAVVSNSPDRPAATYNTVIKGAALAGIIVVQVVAFCYFVYQTLCAGASNNNNNNNNKKRSGATSDTGGSNKRVGRNITLKILIAANLAANALYLFAPVLATFVFW